MPREAGALSVHRNIFVFRVLKKKKKILHRFNYFVYSVRLILVGLMSMTEQFVSCPKGMSFMMMLQNI